MNRNVIALLSLAGVAAIVWAFVVGSGAQPSGSGQPAAIILRAPEGFEVESLGAASSRSAASVLAGRQEAKAGVRFTDGGDVVILLADRTTQRVVEMRAARNGTIVERSWPGQVERRLAWAAEHGDPSVPGLPPATGKNLYH